MPSAEVVRMGQRYRCQAALSIRLTRFSSSSSSHVFVTASPLEEAAAGLTRSGRIEIKPDSRPWQVSQAPYMLLNERRGSMAEMFTHSPYTPSSRVKSFFAIDGGHENDSFGQSRCCSTDASSLRSMLFLIRVVWRSQSCGSSSCRFEGLSGCEEPPIRARTKPLFQMPGLLLRIPLAAER